MGEASMKHIRIEVAKKCTEKIQQVHQSLLLDKLYCNCVNVQLKDLHVEEVKKLTTAQSKLQEKLKNDKEQVL